MTTTARRDPAAGWVRQLPTPAVVALLVTALGLCLRVEHALTFDGPGRGSDYAVYVQGVRWMLQHHRPFNFAADVNYQVRYQPPLWYAASALVLYVTKAERAIAALSVLGFLVRQLLLAKLLRHFTAASPWSAVAALSLHAVLPLGVLIDGKVNPEGFHATLFALAVYLLWRLECEAESSSGLSLRTAVLFAVAAGLALLTKATSVVLVLVAALVLLWFGARTVQSAGLGAAWTRLLRPALIAGAVLLGVVGWWCVPNVMKYGHPFPHDWDLEGAEVHPILAEPVTYRRPLGWALPFEWKPYLEFPIIRSPDEPRPNFWSNIITGTWTDFYNRGFCRLRGGPTTDYVWGGLHGFFGIGPEWAVTLRCVALFRRILPLGLCISSVVILSVFTTAASFFLRRRGGSLVLPLVALLGTFFILLFALTYPFDNMAVLNPRYLLPVSTPLLGCFGIALAQLPRARGLHRGLHALAFVAITLVALFLVYERFGR